MSNNPRALRPGLISVGDVMSFYAKGHPRATCLQIGANDGKNNDPVHEHILAQSWQAVLVEPQKHVFDHELCKTYAGVKHVHLERCAIASSQGELPLYRLGFTNARWATGLSSFDKRSLMDHIDRGYVDRKAQADGIKLPASKDEYLTTEMVPTMSPNDLLDKHGIKNLDVLCIDTEGFDYEVLKLVDWSRFKPAVVLYESKNLSDQDFMGSQELLKKHGYELYWQKGDTIALSSKLASELGTARKLAFKAKAFLQKI